MLVTYVLLAIIFTYMLAELTDSYTCSYDYCCAYMKRSSSSPTIVYTLFVRVVVRIHQHHHMEPVILVSKVCVLLLYSRTLLAHHFFSCCITMQGDEASLFTYDYGLSSQSRKLLGRDIHGKYTDYPNVCASGDRTTHTGLPDSFVQVQNNRLTIDGKKFYFAGWNIWEILEGVYNSIVVHI